MTHARVVQSAEAETQQRQSSVDVLERPRDFGMWLTTGEAREFLNLKSVKSTYEWFKNHGIKRRGDKRVSRFDLQRELDRMKKQPRRLVHANSLANLRKRSA